MKRKVTIKANNSSDRFENPSYSKLDSECQSAGYRLDYAVWIKDRLFLSIIPVDTYATELILDRDEPNTVRAQTTAYGSLSPDEYSKLLDQTAKTAHLLRVIETFDFDKLPHKSAK